MPSHTWKRSHSRVPGPIRLMISINRYYGTVTVFDNYAGKGMIVLPDGREVLVRYSAIRGDGVRCLHKGTPVSFQLEETRRGLVAVCVQLESAAEVEG